MTYDFSFDNKSLGFLLVGVALVGVLLFLAGWLTGANLNKTETLAVNSTAAKTGMAVPEEPALPTEPTIKDDGLRLRRDVAVPPDEVAAPAKQGAAAAAAPASAAASSASSAALPRMSAGPDALDTLPKSIAPKSNPDPVVLSTAAGDGAGSADSEKMTAFAVQVGVFLEEKDADRLVEEMQEKGYTPSIFAAIDANNRMWYSVRIGAYVDRAEATQAATSFTKQEKIKAVVRPFDSL